ncbi:MAG: ParB N-terminal domain-containing protein [Eggerthellaceae bacterium]|nr:ParB N-terminal domain-containing protein [Eggerthellaceae bacterium]
MLIDIDRIVVGDRIRKDFGDIEELADDIRENGLINPPVVNKEYVLLAGERRLRACKLLGWPQIEVRMMDTRDAEHELNIEISENDVRKGFTKSERVDYIKRLLRIEQAKAKERQGERTSARNLTEVQRSDEATAEQFGISSNTMRRELFIADNKDLLDPADFADWDEGKLSTNKAFQRIKAAQKQAEQERDEAEHDAAELRGKLSDLRDEVAALEKQNDELYDLTQQQQVVEREVVREVVPEDYADIKRHVRELENGNRLYSDENASLRKQLEDAQSRLDGSDALNDAKSELAAFVWKYRQLDELAAVIAAAEQLLGIA